MDINLYRKYRPNNFNEVVGQEVAVKTLLNSIKNENISHAYLFTGIRGTGKTSIAKIMSKAINCENINNPIMEDCECGFCSHKDTENSDIFEIDAASNNGVEEVRKIIDNVKFLPIHSKYKVYIIDEVHMLSKGAFNALLKTLEEPPKHVVFILATTEPNKIPMTILSRCQRFDFSRITNEKMKTHLINILDLENIKYEEEAIDNLIYYSQGSMRDLLSLATKVISYDGDVSLESVVISLKLAQNESIEQLVKAIETTDISNINNVYDAMIQAGADESNLVSQIIQKLSDKEMEYKVIDFIKELSIVEKDLKLVKNPVLFLKVNLISLSNKIYNDVDVTPVKVNYEKPIIKPKKEVIVEDYHEEEIYEEVNKKIEEVGKKEEIKKVEIKTDSNITVIDVLSKATKEDKINYQKEFQLIINKLNENKQYGLSKFFETSTIQGASPKGIVTTVDKMFYESFEKRISDIKLCINENLNKEIELYLYEEEHWYSKRKEYIKVIKGMQTKDIYAEAVEIFGAEITNKV